MRPVVRDKYIFMIFVPLPCELVQFITVRSVLKMSCVLIYAQETMNSMFLFGLQKPEMSGTSWRVVQKSGAKIFSVVLFIVNFLS